MSDTALKQAQAFRDQALAYRALGRKADAEIAELQAIGASIHDPDLQQAAQALAANALHIAEPILKQRLKTIPTDVAAIRMLAELAGRIGRYGDAENLLRRALDLAPGFTAARSNLAMVLHRQNRTQDALAELETGLALDPTNPNTTNLKAPALGQIRVCSKPLALFKGGF